MIEPLERPEPAGNLALDFLNTAYLLDRGPIDAVRTPESLVAWLEEAALPSPAQRASLASPVTRRLLHTEAGRLRADLSHIVEAFAAGEPLPESALFGLNRALGASRVSRSLAEVGGDAAPDAGWALRAHEHGASPLAVLAPVAKAAAHLVTESDRSRVRRCASPRCRTWFLDTSKGGQRRWCSMARCGNRTKARRHRSRLSAAS